MLKRPQPIVSTNLLGGHSWIFIVIQALCAILLGGIFLCHPLWSMIALALALGLMLLGCGIQQLVLTFLLRRRFNVGRLFYGLFLFGAGAFLVIDPLLGVLELLLILGIWFIFHGVELLVAAWMARNFACTFRIMTAVNGLLSLLCGVLITLFPPAGSAWVDYVFAFYLIFYGLVTLTVGLRLRAITRSEPRM